MKKNKTYLFYFGHPAQFLFAKNTMRRLQEDNNRVIILIKSKDVLEDLVKSEGFQYKNILNHKRGNSKFSIAFSLLKRMLKIFPLLYKYKPDVMVSTDASTALLGKLLSIKNISITEDDYSIVKQLAKLSYPYTDSILCPQVTDVGSYSAKKIGYPGYMKMAYLHPNFFHPNVEILTKYNLNKPFILIRLAQLNAFHDKGIEGMTPQLIHQIIKIAKSKNKEVYMSIEGEVPKEFQPYTLKIEPADIHHILYATDLFISDSQSMTVEAAILGVPSIRYSSFVGEISVLEELEHKYNLTKGVKINPKELIAELQAYLDDEDLQEKMKSRKEKMLSEKINVTDFLYWLLSDYDTNKQKAKQKPEIFNQFLN